MRRGALCKNVAALLVALSSITANGDAFDADLRRELDAALASFDQAQRVQADDPDRARFLFQSAAQRFESIAAAAVVNGRLEYNLGNCYLQAGDTGKAILHYRRAERLIPRDPLLASNLSEARSRCHTTIRPARGSVVLRNIFFWHYDTSIAERSRAALVVYVLFWILSALRVSVPRPPLSAAAVAAGFACLVLAASLGTQRWLERRTPQGVVTAMDVAVYKGPGAGYQRQFEQPLQPGVEFSVIGDRHGWLNVRLADGNSGWIDASAAQLILTDAKGLRTLRA